MTSSVFPCPRCGRRRAARNATDSRCLDCRDAPPGAHQPWMAHAACIDPQNDPEWWFPNKADDQGATRAQEICGRCNIRDLCAEYAIYHEIPFGIWGGKTPAERTVIIRDRYRRRRAV